jgi:hypothetical protein
MSMSKPDKVLEFEAKTGLVVSRAVTDPDGDYEFYCEYLVGGTHEDDMYECVIDGPAQGEKVYI